MSSFKLEGTIKVIGEKMQISDKFAKRDIVITDSSDMYPQDISFQFTQDKCDILDAYGVGQEVGISFNLRGREWTSPQGEVKHFNTLEGWRIESIEGESQPQAAPATAPAEAEDLPF